MVTEMMDSESSVAGLEPEGSSISRKKSKTASMKTAREPLTTRKLTPVEAI